MVDVEAQLIVHGWDGDVVLQVFSKETAVRHVVVKSVAQLRVDVALQRIARGLRRQKSSRSVACECGCMCYWATHRVQFSPGVIAGCKDSKGAHAFQFLPHSCHTRVPLCGRGVQSPQCGIHIVNGSHWRGGRGGRQARQKTVFC